MQHRIVPDADTGADAGRESGVDVNRYPVLDIGAGPDINQFGLRPQRRRVPNANPGGQSNLTDQARGRGNPGLRITVRPVPGDGHDQRSGHGVHRRARREIGHIGR